MGSNVSACLVFIINGVSQTLLYSFWLDIKNQDYFCFYSEN